MKKNNTLKTTGHLGIETLFSKKWDIKWLYPGMHVKRWLLLSWIGLIIFSLGFILITNIKIPIGIELATVKFIRFATGLNISTKIIDVTFIVLGLFLIILGFRGLFLSIYTTLIPYQERKIVDIIYEKRQLASKFKIMVIGGGTGLSSLLRGLKQYTSNITAAVTVADDGGSSGRLRKELGILPPGDIRNCLIALADEESLMGELFKYRFSNGEGLSGHNFGNLFLTVMNVISGEHFDVATKQAGKILAIRGKVLPVTLDNIILCAEYPDCRIVEGESNISKIKSPIKTVFLKPKYCKALPEVIEEIKSSKAIILGPGSLYTSIICNLLVPEIAETIKKSNAVKIYVCNVMTQPGETDNFKASDHVKVIFNHVGFKIFDYILINNMPIKDKNLLEKYKKDGAIPVENDIAELEKLGTSPIQAPIISETNLVRHDPQKLAEALLKIIFTQ